MFSENVFTFLKMTLNSILLTSFIVEIKVKF